MERLKTLLEKNGVSQYRLAKEIGAPVTTVNGWLHDKAKTPRDNYLNKLAEFFHVHPAWLRYGDEQYAPQKDDEILYLLNEAELLGVKDDCISYIKFKINEAMQKQKIAPSKKKIRKSAG